MKAPDVVYVSWCTRCGVPILADLHTRVATSCPDCPQGRKVNGKHGPRIEITRYQLAPAATRRQRLAAPARRGAQR